MIQPVELQQTFPIVFDGITTTTTAVWKTLRAARDGDLARVAQLVSEQPILACGKYNYAPPIHFAVREGHAELVRFLVTHGGLFPSYRTDLFGDGLLTMARERGHTDVAQLLEDVSHDPSLASPCVAPTDDTRIEFPRNEERLRFRAMLDDRLNGRCPLADIETALDENHSLAEDPYQWWGEGVLSTPAKCGDVELVELLMRYGARVPDVTKWCARYYFKRDDMAALLLERGMNPNHMNWHRVTLLHEMAFAGHTHKARMLLDHGADINAVDEEYR